MSDPWSGARTLDLEGLSVMLAMPSHRDIHPLTVAALLQTQVALLERGIPLSIEVTHGASVVHHARSKMAWQFLQSKHNRLFWVDSDMVWTADDFLRILALSSVLPVVAGVYTAKQDPALFMVRGDLGSLEANEWGCLPFGGIGMGFTCVSRDVMQALAGRSPRKRFNGVPEPIPHIFALKGDDIDDGLGAEGEDMRFFAEAKACGFQLWVDPSLKLGHAGGKVYSARLIDFLQAAAPAIEPATVSSAA